MTFEGIMTALVTPVKADGGIDTNRLKQLVDHQVASGVHSLLILGGTGEYSALTAEGRVEAVTRCVEAAAGRLPVVAGVLEPGLGEAVKTARAFQSAGADALLVLTPFYVHPTQAGIADFYRAFDRAVGMPFLIYNIPYRTYVNILPETVRTLAGELPGLVGIKECSPSLGQAIELLNLVGDRLSVLSGEEFLATSEMLLGASGAVMATANLVPEVWVELYALCKAGSAPESAALLRRYYPLFKLIFSEVNPGPLKYAMALRGLDMGEAMLPLLPPSDELKAALAAEMRRLNLIP